MNLTNQTLRLAMMAGSLRNACGLSTWMFNGKGELYYTTSPDEKQMLLFLNISGCLKYALAVDRSIEKPFIMSDNMGLVWVGEYAHPLEQVREKQLVLVGPMFNSEISLRFLEERLQKLDISVQLRNSCYQALKRIPILEVSVMRQYVKMLHGAIYFTDISEQEFVYQPRTFEEKEEKEEKEIHFTDYERSMARERTILQCIKEGNLGYQSLVEQETRYVQMNDFQTGNPLREAKNTVMMFTTLCCRAAIEGGLSIKEAKDLEIDTVRKVENSNTLSEIILVRRNMLEEYIRRVAQRKETTGISKPIRDCCNYVQAHLLDELNLGIIAKNVGYTEYYLSRKFQKEMGKKLVTYIRDCRLDFAKVWLISSEKSIQEISEELQFGTRNYFSRVFKEEVGITPGEYRERALMGIMEK